MSEVTPFRAAVLEEMARREPEIRADERARLMRELDIELLRLRDESLRGNPDNQHGERVVIGAIRSWAVAPEREGIENPIEKVQQAASPEQARTGEHPSRYRRALVSIQSHAQTDDNAASMVWTARVATYPGPLDQALEAVPEHLREVVAARFRPAPVHEEGSTNG